MLKLWGRPTSTCTQRVLWTLHEVGIPYSLTLASATMGPDGHIWQGHIAYGVVDTYGYAGLNPNRTIPTIDDDGFVLWESNAIVAYLARRYAPKELFNDDETVFARSLQWMLWTNSNLEGPLTPLINHLERLPVEKRSAEAVEQARVEMNDKITIVEAHLDRNDWMAGPEFSLGDISIGVAVTRWMHCGLEQPTRPAIARWLDRLGRRPAYQEHVAPRKKHFQ